MAVLDLGVRSQDVWALDALSAHRLEMEAEVSALHTDISAQPADDQYADGEDPTSCSTSVTATDCSVGCSVFPDDEEYSTSCYTTSCTDNVGCRPTGTTTTEETTEACVPETPPPRPQTGQVPMLGGGGDGGSTWDGGDGGNPGPTPTPNPNDPEDPPEDDPENPEPPPEDDDPEDPEDPPDDDPPPPPDPPQPNTILWIFHTMIPTPSFLLYYYWWHSREINDQSWSICDQNNDRPCNNDASCNDAEGPDDDFNYPFPDGSYEMFRGRSEGCVYEGTSQEAGTLTCPGFDEVVQCRAVSDPQGIPCVSARFEETVYCEYYKP